MKSAITRLMLVTLLAAALLYFEATHAYAATLYYDNIAGSGDSHWETLGNWWQDPGHVTLAPSLPSNGDLVYIDGSGVLAQLLGSPLSLAQIIVGQYSGGSGAELYGVIGDAIFNGHSYNQGNIIGNAIFGQYSYNGSNGAVTGDAAFSGETYNQGIVGGSATFDDVSYNGSGGTVGGDASFTGHTYNEGGVAGSGMFTDTSYNGSGGTVGGDATFTDHTYNEGHVMGAAFLSGQAYNGSAGMIDASGIAGTLQGVVVSAEPAPEPVRAVATVSAFRPVGSSIVRRQANLAAVAAAASGVTGAERGEAAFEPSAPVAQAASLDSSVRVSTAEALAFVQRYQQIAKILETLAKFVRAPIFGQNGHGLSMQ